MNDLALVNSLRFTTLAVTFGELHLAGEHHFEVDGVGGVPPAVADVHACAVLDDHTAMCWGANASGELGHGTQDSHEAARPVVDAAGNAVTGISQVGVAGSHSCAITGPATTASVVCWGENNDGENGTGTVSEA